MDTSRTGTDKPQISSSPPIATGLSPTRAPRRRDNRLLGRLIDTPHSFPMHTDPHRFSYFILYDYTHFATADVFPKGAHTFLDRLHTHARPGELTSHRALISIFMRASRAYTRQVSASTTRAKVMCSGETPSKTSQECCFIQKQDSESARMASKIYATFNSYEGR